MSITTQHNQSFLDIAIQEHGDADAAVLIAIENGVDLSSDLTPGTSLSSISFESDTRVYESSIEVSKEVTYSMQHNQSLLDVAIQLGGDVQTAVELAVLNNMTLSEELAVGREIVYTGLKVASSSIVENFKRNGFIPATGTTILINRQTGYVLAGYVTNGYVIYGN